MTSRFWGASKNGLLGGFQGGASAGGGGAGGTATLVSVTGVDKSRYVDVTGTPTRAFASNADVGLTCAVSASAAAANSKFHFEMLTTGISGASGGAVSVGIFDGSINLDSSGFLNDDPGTNSVAGLTFKMVLGATTIGITRNGTSANPTVAAIAAGDGIIIECNTATGTIDSWFWDASLASTTSLGATITLSGAYIPAAYWAFVGTGKTTDAGVFNPGSSAFVKAATATFGNY